MRDDISAMNLEDTPTSGLFSLYSDSLKELRRREVIRSTNNPCADYAEFLAAKGLGLRLAGKSTKGYDVVDDNGGKYEVKARRITSHNKSRQLSVIRDLPGDHFGFLIGVLFAEDFSVSRACIVPKAVVVGKAEYRKHVNGWVLHLRDDIWECEGVRDVTSELQSAAKSIG